MIMYTQPTISMNSARDSYIYVKSAPDVTSFFLFVSISMPESNTQDYVRYSG